MEGTDYLSGPFVAEDAELEKVRHVAARAFKTLAEFADDGAWSYEVVQDKEPSAVHGQHWSSSTASMILFAMGIATGRVESLTLAPYVSQLADKDGKRSDKFNDSFRSFLKNIQPKPLQQWHTKSGTYGKDDPLTLLWLLEIFGKKLGLTSDLEKARQNMYERFVAAARHRVTKVFKSSQPWIAAFEKPDSDSENIEHVFLILRVVQLYDHLRLTGRIRGLPKPEPLIRYLQHRLHLHLSYSSIQDSNYDAAELAFTMEALLLLKPNAIGAATIDRCRHVLLETQEKTPYWRPLRPFLAKPQGMVLLPLSVEIGNSLIRSCEMLARQEHSQANRSRDIALFQRYTGWLFGRMVEGTTGKRKFFGWRSEHADDLDKIHLWETSQVLLYLLQYDSFLRKYRAERALQCMNLKISEPDAADRYGPALTETALQRWTVGVDPVNGRGPVEITEYNIYARIGREYVRPRSEATRDPYLYSMLFYGPQGTGKTELAKSVARELALPFISISPSDFMVSGDTLVEARAKQLFDVLGAQTGAVILLDEIDRLILDRNSEKYDRQSDPFQLMTPGMLTKLQNLRKMSRSIFIISTNYAERIDQAIKRKGRIDKQYLVLPPDRRMRATTLNKELESAFKSKDLPVKNVPTIEQLERTTDRDTALWVFSELQSLAVDTADKVGNQGRTNSVLQVISDEVTKVKPAIQIVAYSSRFNREFAKRQPEQPNQPVAAMSADQQPYEELTMLMFLVAESGRDANPEEKELWCDVFGNTHSERVKAFSKHLEHLEDKSIVARLTKFDVTLDRSAKV